MLGLHSIGVSDGSVFWNWFLQTYNLTRFFAKSRKWKQGSCGFFFFIPASTSHPTPPKGEKGFCKPRGLSLKISHAQGCDIEAPTAPDPEIQVGSLVTSLRKHVPTYQAQHQLPQLCVESTRKKTEDKTMCLSRMTRPANRTQRSWCQAMKQKTLDTKDIRPASAYVTLGVINKNAIETARLVLNMMHFPHWESGTGHCQHRLPQWSRAGKFQLLMKWRPEISGENWLWALLHRFCYLINCTQTVAFKANVVCLELIEY